jgi:hypothetical protein
MPGQPAPPVLTGHPASRTRRAGHALFVGRAQELAELGDALDAARAGRGCLVLVSGPPGAGKTALAEELAVIARERGVAVAWGRCREGGGTPAYWAWTQILRASFRAFAQWADVEPGYSGTRRLAQIVPELGAQSDNPPSLGSANDNEHERFALFDQVARLLRAAAEARPVLVILDDLHAADAPTLSLLQFVASLLSDARLLLVATHREPQAVLPPAVSDRVAVLRRSARQLRLEGLTEADLRRLLMEGYGAIPSPAFVARLHRLTQGNPFFVHTILADVLTQREAPTAWDIGEHQLPVPEDVSQVVGRSLASLAPEEQQTLGVAAVIGQEFGVDVLAPLCRRTRADLAELLARPRLARFVSPVPATAGRYRFSHALVRESLYEQLAPQERAALHRDVAASIERGSQADEAVRLADLAHHWYEATRSGADVERAIHWAEQAAAHAAARLAYEEAAMHYERALGALARRADPDAGQRCQLLLALGRTWNLSGDTAAARRAFLESAALARELGTPERLARAALGIGAVAIYLEAGETDDLLVGLLEEALRALPPTDSGLRAMVTARLAYELQFAWPVARVRELAQEAIDIGSRLGDPAALGYVLLWAGPSLQWRNLEARLTLADTMLRLSEASGLAELALMGHVRRVRVFAECGDAAAMHAEIRMLEALVERVRLPSYRWWPALWRAAHAAAVGEFDVAEVLALEARGIGQSTYAFAANALCQAQRIFIAWQRGQLAEAAALVGSVATPANRNLVRCVVAWMRAEMGQEVDARAEFEALAVGGFAPVREDQYELLSLALLARCCAILGDRARAQRLRERLAPFAGRCVYQGVAANYVGSSSYYLGLLAATLRRWSEAERQFATARRIDQQLGARPWVARTLHAWARMLVQRSNPADHARARDLLRETLDIARSLGMLDLERQALAEQDRLESLARDRGAAPEADTAGGAMPAGRAGAHYLFRREGDFWTVGPEPAVVRVRHTKGMDDLAYLLANPDHDVHALDLIATAGAAVPEAAPYAEGTITRSAAGAGPSPSADARARAAYRGRRAELRDELADAERCNDAVRVLRARAEIEAIERELVAAYRARQTRSRGDPVERARKTVAWRIRHALTLVDRVHPTIGRHLRDAVKTGICCRYMSRDGVTWSLSP